MPPSVQQHSDLRARLTPLQVATLSSAVRDTELASNTATQNNANDANNQCSNRRQVNSNTDNYIKNNTNKHNYSNKNYKNDVTNYRNVTNSNDHNCKSFKTFPSSVKTAASVGIMGNFKTPVLVSTVLVLLLVSVMATAAPSIGGRVRDGNTLSTVYSMSREGRQTTSSCFNDPAKQYTCEMCAKQTRSLYVFKLCCMSEANALNWCRSFLAYGIN